MRNARTDSNQKEIVTALRSVGATVQSLAPVGQGVPDLLVAFRGVNYLIEVKTPTGKLNPIQTAFHANWGAPIGVCVTQDDALQHIGAITQ
jgi:hypothetical protein